MVYKVKWGKPKTVGVIKVDMKKLKEPPLAKMKLKDNIVLVDSEKWTWEYPLDKNSSLVDG